MFQYSLILGIGIAYTFILAQTVIALQNCKSNFNETKFKVYAQLMHAVVDNLIQNEQSLDYVHSISEEQSLDQHKYDTNNSLSTDTHGLFDSETTHSHALFENKSIGFDTQLSPDTYAFEKPTKIPYSLL